MLLLGPAAGAVEIQFLWRATGTDSITVTPGQEVVLDAWAHVGEPGITFAAVSALATPGLLEAVDYEVCPLGFGNTLAGRCGTDLYTILEPSGLNNIVLNTQHGGAPDLVTVPGLSGSSGALQPPPFPGLANESFVLASITYAVLGLGSGEVLPYYRGGIDGVVTVGFDAQSPPAGRGVVQRVVEGHAASGRQPSPSSAAAADDHP